MTQRELNIETVLWAFTNTGYYLSIPIIFTIIQTVISIIAGLVSIISGYFIVRKHINNYIISKRQRYELHNDKMKLVEEETIKQKTN